jgi:ABC-type antimicrobial peptide transport system permease subunit
MAINELAPAGMDTSIRIASEELRRSTQERRAYTFYLSLVAAVGLALAAIGLYGLIAYSVTRRTGEIGIRMAVGATRMSIHNLILSEGMKLVGLGLALGLVAALATTRVLQSQLFEVTPWDPATLAVISVVLLAATAMACLLPARRAAKVEPMVALRTE